MKIDHEVPDSFSNDKDEGITIYLKLNYKVLLLVFVIFDVFHVSLNELLARSLGYSVIERTVHSGYTGLMSLV